MKKRLSVLFALLLILSLIPASDGAGFTQGEIIIFGSYEQDNNPANGNEPIEWLILDIQDGNALFVSRYVLDCQLYHTSLEDITWERCTLRTWLNGEFLSDAFTSSEQDQILTTTVLADKNPRYSTDPGNITNDKIFILSNTEASRYFSSEAERQCKPTAYALSQDCDNTYSDNDTCIWWLRSPSYAQFLADWVNKNGQINNEGLFVTSEGVGVRPAMWISLDDYDAVKREREPTEYISGDFSYILLEDGTAEIKLYSGGEENISIPSKLNDIKVTSIGESSFSECDSLINVTIPKSVTAIGDGAFFHCPNLSYIEIPDSVTIIGNAAFRSCINLTKIKIPDSVTSIGDYAFYDTSLLTMMIPDSVTSIGDSAFSWCYNLTNVIIPNSVTFIGDHAFYSCPKLASIEIPDSITAIGNSTFSYCESLKEIEIPNSVISIGFYAFSDCINLKSVTIPDSVTYIDPLAFDGCYPTIKVNNKSYAEQYCIDNGLHYTYSDAGDRLFCPQCGKQISVDSNFCMYCGHQIISGFDSTADPSASVK